VTNPVMYEIKASIVLGALDGIASNVIGFYLVTISDSDAMNLFLLLAVFSGWIVLISAL
jgi:heme O synthase-like polyprenyltransferase